MADNKAFRAAPALWQRCENDVARWDDATAFHCILELRSRVEQLEVANTKSPEVKTGATCPHIMTSDEGTSYCGLAEQTARIGKSDVPVNTSAQPKPTSSLVERVAAVIADDPQVVDIWHEDARAAIREMAAWLRERGSWNQVTVADVLEREANHG